MPRATPERKRDTVPPQPRDNRPVHTIRHRSIKASIWRNVTAKGPVYNVIVVRGFKDGDGWKDSHSFGYDDLPIVAKLLNDCHSFITSLNERERRKVPAAADAMPADPPAPDRTRRPERPA
ncbi:MAG: hypothetical protein ABSH08_07050 [Tepidisphaeraceae bacterium]|jgi:hypothetical protein